jgi:hypothetical protein
VTRRTRIHPRRKWFGQFLERGLTLLGLAAFHGHRDMAALLVQNGADIHATCFVNRDGSMLDVSLKEDDADEFEPAIPAARSTPRETDAFGIAVDQGRYDLALILLSRAVSPRFASTLLSPSLPSVARTGLSSGTLGHAVAPPGFRRRIPRTLGRRAAADDGVDGRAGLAAPSSSHSARAHRTRCHRLWFSFRTSSVVVRSTSPPSPPTEGLQQSASTHLFSPTVT